MHLPEKHLPLHFGTSVWDQNSDYQDSTAELRSDLKTEVLIIGAGMSGNLLAHTLTARGHEVVVVDANHIGRGSSLANTGLLQYWSDTMLWELAEQIGDTDAVLFYETCLKSMYQLTELATELELGDAYRVTKSIYFASHESDVEKLTKEYEYLKQYDFPVELISHEKLLEEYGIDKPLALRTSKDASVDPYAFIQALSAKNKSQGVRYYENTEIDLSSIRDHQVETVSGQRIEFEYVAFATGYVEIYPQIKGRVEINRTYAVASHVLKQLPWDEQVMFWETKEPYLYFRMTADHRIVVGGLDEAVETVETDPDKLRAKYEKLRDSFNQLVRGYDIEIDYAWNALFGTSKDNLPFLGADPERSNHFYILGYEGNGTCYSCAGAHIVADLIEGLHNPYSHIVSLSR